MKQSSALMLKGAILLVGLAAAAFLLWEPHVEGRNAHATLFQIYFRDPFLAYVYVGSLAFFLALYRAFGLAGHVANHGFGSQGTVEALRSIKRCGLTLLGFVAGGVVLILALGDGEDRPAGLFMSLLAATASAGIALVAAYLARNARLALEKAHGGRA